MKSWLIPQFLSTFPIIFTFNLVNCTDTDHLNQDEPDPLTSLVSLFGSSSHYEPEMENRRRGGDREDESGEESEYRNEEMMTTECFCSVIVNGNHNFRGEEAICGRNRRRIYCPQSGGCQTATANVEGFVSTVKTCGNDREGIGCRIQRQKAQFVGEVAVQRCFCMGRLCNTATGKVTGQSFGLLWILSYLLSLFLD